MGLTKKKSATYSAFKKPVGVPSKSPICQIYVVDYGRFR